MTKSPTLPRFLSIVVLAALAGASRAEDVRFGGARTFGLAGAGIALPLDVYETHTLNPALLGLAGKKFRFGVPFVGYHTQNISLGQVNDLVNDLDSGGVDDNEVVTLARKYGSDSKELGINGFAGASYAHFALSFRAEALVRSIPNGALRTFLKSNDNDYTNAPIDSRLDAYGLGYYQSNLSYGHALPMKKGDTLSFGASVRAVSAYYAHKVADADAIASDGDVRNGTEIGGNDDSIERSGVGVDFGGVGSLHTLPNATFGFDVRNLVEPNITFVRTRPDTDFPLRRDLRPFKRQVGVGAAYVKDKYLVALDLVDLGNHAAAGGFRIGAEYAFNKLFAVRGGYDSRSKFVVGVSVYGLNAAISADGTTSIVSSLRF